MQEELDRFQKNDVWKIIELLKGKYVVGAKWVFRNKLDETGKVVRNKARLVAKGYSQQKGIDYTETFAHFAHLEAIHVLLPFASRHALMLYQMDVKSTFVNGIIKEEVYMEQPLGFKSSIYPHHVFKLNRDHCSSHWL